MNTPTISAKEAFLKYLQNMDLEMLDLILDDSITYFGVSKNAFLEKLSYIFNQYRVAGGIENPKLIQHRKHQNTYYLFMPIITYSLKFAIEEKEGKIVKLYNNKTVKSKDDVEQLCQFCLCFGDDEKASFHPSNEYIITLHNCIIAYEELENDKIQILTSNDIHKWLNKHSSLYEEVKEEYLFFKFNDFRNLYFGLEYYFKQLQSYPEVREALKSFCKFNLDRLHQWLEDYNRLAFCRVLGFFQLPSEIDLKNNRIKYAPCSNIYFKGDDFFALIKFNELYHKYFDNYMFSAKNLL